MSAAVTATPPAWTPVVAAVTASQALEVARTVAHRLRDREALLQINQRAFAQSRYPDTLHWNPCGLAHGDAGLALACGYFNRCWPGQGWDETGHGYLLHAAHAARSSVTQPGLHAGLAGLAFAARSLPPAPAAPHDWLTACDRALASRVLEIAGSLHQRHGVAVSDFDAISGLAGIGAYLIGGAAPPPADVAWQALVEALVTLTSSTEAEPHWFTPKHLMGDNPMAQAHPHGNMNCGLAHGIPGPLALMALALRHSAGADQLHPGLADAVRRTATWLVAQQMHDEFGVNWPTVVPRTANGQAAHGLVGSRAAWCYGAPGVARALWLSGQALEDNALCDLAVDAMAAVYRRPMADRQIDSPTFCHGVAGLLQVTLRFAQDTGQPLFRDAADVLCRQVLSEFSPDHALGFCSIEPEGNRVDHCGLLDGAAGVAMVLLAASTEQAPDWDRVFLLS